MSIKPNMSRYVFYEIPNNVSGRFFIKLLKRYLNKDRWSILVKGQHMTEEGKKDSYAQYYGQSIEQSTHLRVYINDKLPKVTEETVTTTPLEKEFEGRDDRFNQAMKNIFGDNYNVRS